MIVRLPFGDDNTFVPVGVVSKSYSLVQHDTVLDFAIGALNRAKVPVEHVAAELKITEYGERMALNFYLPEAYGFDPGDGHPMALRLECLNSVDGSTRFRAFMGWFRPVCSNGLITGLTRFDVRRRHVGNLRLEDIDPILTAGLNESETEKETFERWREADITLVQLAPWVNKNLREGWGIKAAARAFHIARSGFDAEVVGKYRGSIPTRIAMRPTKRVPGAPQRCRNLYDLSQILAWLAKERRDVQEQLKWRERIPELMKPLLN